MAGTHSSGNCCRIFDCFSSNVRSTAFPFHSFPLWRKMETNDELKIGVFLVQDLTLSKQIVQIPVINLAGILLIHRKQFDDEARGLHGDIYIAVGADFHVSYTSDFFQ